MAGTVKKKLTASELAASKVESLKVAGLSAFGDSDSTGDADWGGCNPEWIQSVVTKITELGGAVIFGTSRDKGACLVTLLLNKDKKTIWVGSGEDLNEELESICAVLDTMA